MLYVDFNKGFIRATIILVSDTKFQIANTFTMVNLIEIYLVSNILVKMDITLKL